jgi:hypothetical protein
MKRRTFLSSMLALVAAPAALCGMSFPKKELTDEELIKRLIASPVRNTHHIDVRSYSEIIKEIMETHKKCDNSRRNKK